MSHRPSASQARRVALFVGVDEYEDPTIHPLRGAVADAEALCDFSSRHGLFDLEPRLLRNPRIGEIQREVNALTCGLPPGSVFLFYFSGHGVEQGGGHQHHLCCKDTQRTTGQKVNPAFALDFLTSDDAPFHRIVILDACRSPLESDKGIGASRRGTATQSRYLEDLCDIIRQRSEEPESAGNGPVGSLTILHACDPGKTAEEFLGPDGKTHGIFSWALLEELEDAAANHATVAIDSVLQDKLEQRMERLSGLVGGQRPGLQKSGRGPILMKSDFSVTPYLAWLDGLSRTWGLEDERKRRLLRILLSEPDNPIYTACMEAVRHFGNQALENGGAAPTDATATRIFNSMCATQEPERIVVEVPAPTSRPQPPPLPRHGDASPLSKEDRDLIRGFLEKAALLNWRNRAVVAQRILNAQTVEAAVEALDDLVFQTLQSLGCQNNIVATRPGTRQYTPLQVGADPFLDSGHTVSKFEIEYGLWDDPSASKVKAALQRAFVAAKLLQR